MTCGRSAANFALCTVGEVITQVRHVAIVETNSCMQHHKRALLAYCYNNTIADDL